MFCIGEKKEERESGVTMEVCAKQLEPLAKAIDAKMWESVAIAYEPVWVSQFYTTVFIIFVVSVNHFDQELIYLFSVVWKCYTVQAIGTGLTATPEMAQETHKNIRSWVSDNVSPDVAAAVRIQYGGSMKGANAKELLAQPDIDGGLIGGASLTEDFFNVVNGAK